MDTIPKAGNYRMFTEVLQDYLAFKQTQKKILHVNFLINLAQKTLTLTTWRKCNLSFKRFMGISKIIFVLAFIWKQKILLLWQCPNGEKTIILNLFSA